MDIVILGAGNVGSYFGKALKDKEHTILQVYSLHLDHAKVLAKKLNCSATDDISKINKKAEIIIFAVTDHALEDLVKKINIPEAIAIHTSGSTDMNIFKGHFNHFGVLYPVQTFALTDRVDWARLPICIEGSDAKTFTKIKKLALCISSKVVKMNSTKRMTLHTAAVFANNFTNHLYVLANEILKKDHISFKLLLPLIEQSSINLQHESPSNLQTGPAKRNNLVTIKKHLKLLSDSPEFAKIYKMMSAAITEEHK